MSWNKGQTGDGDLSAEWARLMKDQTSAWEGAQSLRKEVTRRVGQSSEIPTDMLVRVDAADKLIELERVGRGTS